MKQHSLEAYQRAMDLLKEGNKAAYVSNELTLPIQTVCNWRDGAVPWHARVSLKPSSELAYLIGALFGDGTSTNVSNGRAVQLTAKDIDFVEAFAVMASRVFERPVSILFSKALNMPYCRVQSTTFCNWFDALSLRDIECLILGYEPLFLRGIFDSDGSATAWFDGKTMKQKVTIYTSDTSFSIFIAKVLRRLGFTPKIRSFDRRGRILFNGGVTKKIEHHIIIERKAEFERFGIEIGSSIPRKMYVWQTYFASPEFKERVRKS